MRCPRLGRKIYVKGYKNMIEPKIEPKHESKIKELYFNKMMSFEEIALRSKNRYTAREIKTYILNYINSFNKK